VAVTHHGYDNSWGTTAKLIMNDKNSLSGLQVDNFKIERLLGSGGMASVYLASDVSLKRDVVIKVLLPTLAENEELRLRFQREAQATARLHHPNIVQVYSTGSIPDTSPYIALQYIRGGSLSEHLQQLTKQGQWVSIIYALSIARQMADALRVAHQTNIIHRDLKPSNILLRTDGTPVLSDLGIAAIQQATMRLTQTGGIIGTPNYMSPEQATGQAIDGRSDIYSLGVIIYELLSGRLPFDGDSPWAILHQHIYEQPTPLVQVRPDLTPQTIRLVDTCLQKKPEDRFPNAQALVAALDGAIAAENANPLLTVTASLATVIEPAVTPIPGTLEKTPTQPPTPSPGIEKRPWWPYALILMLMLLVAAGALFIWQRNQMAEPANEELQTPVSEIIVVTATSAPLQPTVTIASSVTPGAVATEEALVTVTPEQTASRGETVFQTVDSLVYASKGRNETGLYVFPGQTVSINYEGGQWQAGPSPAWPLVGPEGDPQVLSKPSFPVPDAPVASLIAGIGHAPPFLIGSGTSFVASTEGNLWLAANDDGYNDNLGEMSVSIQLGPLPEATEESLQISQGLVAYSCGSGGKNQIFVYDLDRGEQFPLANQPENSVVPAFSRVGTKIAYRSNVSGTWQIYISGIDGANFRQLTSGAGNNYEANWSPDGSQMAFVSDRSGTRQIFIMNSDGTNQQQLTFNNEYNDDPSWSVTGQIAYESDQDGSFNIYQLPPQGGVPLLLLDAGNSSTTPAWSPDGTQVAFESRVGEVRHIWVAKSDGTDLQRITTEGTNNERPAWSSDGRRIAFHTNYQQSSDSQSDIWVIDIETGVLQRLTSRGDCYDPAWGWSVRTQQAELPPVREGVEACGLYTGALVTAGSNTRLWNAPDVLSGQALESVDPGTSLRVIDGPVWGRIRRDIDASEWWWQVEGESEDLTGWVWQARLLECEGT
jgi:serine/threonine-protein kinase